MAKKPLAENELYKAAPLLKALEGKEYHPEDNVLKLIEEELKPIEKILLNIEKDNQKFLKDCHYKD